LLKCCEKYFQYEVILDNNIYNGYAWSIV